MVWNNFVVVVTRHVTFWMAVLSVVGFSAADAQGVNDITLSLSATTANAGDTVEVALSMSIQGDAPETMIVYLAYDSMVLSPNTDEYELLLTNPVSKEPILDEDGNTMAVRRAVRPSAAISGFGFDSEVHQSEGVVGIVIVGQNSGAIPAGSLFTMAFTVGEELPNGSMTSVVGLQDDNAIVIPDGSGGVAPAVTSAARSDSVALAYAFEDTTIAIGCNAPEIPGGISASRDRSDGVLVSWNAIATANVEYRVYRSDTSNIAFAMPIGEGWTSSTSFLDITARVPDVALGDGCTVPSQSTPIHYFYWVKARTNGGCQGDLGSAAEGFRTAAQKLLTTAALLPVGGRTGTGLVYGLALLVLLWRCAVIKRTAE